MAWADSARFYPIHGEQLPSVTTFLGIIDKSGPLMGWAVKEERNAFMTAMLTVLTGPHAADPNEILKAVELATKGVKASDKVKQKAADIGTAAHALIEWHTRRMLGEKVGPEPIVPDASAWAVESWKDWVKEVEFTPVAVEQTVHCLGCGYAGKYDWVAKVKRVLTLGDIKTGKAIYAESFLQNRAYRHAAKKLGMATEQGMILRLPKTPDDPAFEAMVVPETSMADVLAALTLWRWKRRMEGKTVGTMAPVKQSAVHAFVNEGRDN